MDEPTDDHSGSRGGRGRREGNRRPGLPLLLGLLATLAFAALFLLVDRAWERQLAERHHANQASEVASKRTRLESTINSLVHATIGLSAYAEARPGLDADEFARVARRLYRRDPGVFRSLTLLAGSHIHFIYPLEGNVEALGLDVANHPQQAESFHRVRQKGQTVVAGPWTLAQGGTGLLVRSPVGDGDRGEERASQELHPMSPYSMSSVALDFDEILRRAGFDREANELQFALEGRDGTGPGGEVFHDPHGIADGAVDFRQTVSFAGGEWGLLATTTPDAQELARPPAWWVFGLAGSLALGALTWRMSGHMRDRHRLLSRYHSLVNNLEDATLVVRGARVLWTNPAFRRTTGLAAPPEGRIEDFGLFHPEDRGQLPRGLDFSEDDPDPNGHQVRVRMADGAWRYHLLRWVPIPWEQAGATLLILVDVHENRLLFEALAEARDLQQAMFEAMPGHALVIGDDGVVRRTFGEGRMTEGGGAEPSGEPDLVGHAIEELLPEDLARHFRGVVAKSLEERALQTTEYCLPAGVLHPVSGRSDVFDADAGDTRRWFEARVRPIAAQFEGRGAVVWHALDVTDRRHLEERLQTLAWQDPLTAAANRAAMERAFPRMASRARRSGGHLALIFIDLDRFKPVNDEYGHAVGDQLLRKLSTELGARLRAEDLLVRLGGDEFLVLTGPLDSPYEVRPIIERLNAVFETDRELSLEGGESVRVSITASIGVAFYPEHGEQLPGLIAAADQAMYRVKGEGRNAVAWVDEPDGSIQPLE